MVSKRCVHVFQKAIHSCSLTLQNPYPSCYPQVSQTNKQEHETNMLKVFLETIVTVPNSLTHKHNSNQHNCNEPQEKLIPLHTSKKLYVMPNLCLRVMCKMVC